MPFDTLLILTPLLYRYAKWNKHNINGKEEDVLARTDEPVERTLASVVRRGRGGWGR